MTELPDDIGSNPIGRINKLRGDMMNEDSVIRLAIFTLVYVLAMMIIVILQSQYIDSFDTNIQQPNTDIIVSLSNGNISLPQTNLTDDDIYIILQQYDWDEWSYNEKAALTTMMIYASIDYTFDDEFILHTSSVNRSEDIFSAYIDLTEHAGY